MAIPTSIVSGIAGSGLLVLSPFIWLITLVRGRPPQPLFSAAAAVIRYQARYYAYMSLVTDVYPRRLFGDSRTDWVGGWVSEDEEERRRDFRLPLSEGAKWLMRLIVVLGIAATIGNVVLQLELRPTPNPALTAAETRLENASLAYVGSVQGCGSARALTCVAAGDRAWSAAFDRFASSLSHIPFSASQHEQAAALIDDARAIGQALLDASRSHTKAQHTKAFGKVRLLLAIFEADAKSLLGHTL